MYICNKIKLTALEAKVPMTPAAFAALDGNNLCIFYSVLKQEFTINITVGSKTKPQPIWSVTIYMLTNKCI